MFFLRLRSDPASRTFLQQKLGRLHAGITAKPLLHDFAFQEVGHGEQAHALVMDHPRFHQCITLPTRGSHVRREVGGLVVAIGAEPFFLAIQRRFLMASKGSMAKASMVA